MNHPHQPSFKLVVIDRFRTLENKGTHLETLRCHGWGGGERRTPEKQLNASDLLFGWPLKLIESPELSFNTSNDSFLLFENASLNSDEKHKQLSYTIFPHIYLNPFKHILTLTSRDMNKNVKLPTSQREVIQFRMALKNTVIIIILWCALTIFLLSERTS